MSDEVCKPIFDFLIVKTPEPTRTMMCFILLVVLSMFMSMLIRLNRHKIGILHYAVYLLQNTRFH